MDGSCIPYLHENNATTNITRGRNARENENEKKFPFIMRYQPVYANYCGGLWKKRDSCRNTEATDTSILFEATLQEWVQNRQVQQSVRHVSYAAVCLTTKAAVSTMPLLIHVLWCPAPFPFALLCFRHFIELFSAFFSAAHTILFQHSNPPSALRAGVKAVTKLAFHTIFGICWSGSQ